MGRKKKQVEKQYIWCYYCDREFDDENTLISHQVARHFKCEYCGKKLGTFRGLMSHAKTNHHVDLPAVPHALPGRDNTATDIHGMTGIPEVALFEYKVKKAKELGLPVPRREAAVIRNPKQEFAAKLEESRTQSQMADSFASMAVPSVPMNTPFMGGMVPMMGGMNVPGMSPMMGGVMPTPAMPTPAMPTPAMPAATMPTATMPTATMPTATMPTPGMPAPPLATPGMVAPTMNMYNPYPNLTPQTNAGGAGKVSKMVYIRTDISMEEWRASQPQYRYQEFVSAANAPR